MKKWFFLCFVVLGTVFFVPPAHVLAANATPGTGGNLGDPGRPDFGTTNNPFDTGQRRTAGCDLRTQEKTFLGFPTWFHYLDGETVTDSQGGNSCRPYLHSARDIWLIAAAVFEIILRLASIAAVGFVIWGGIQYIISQGVPERLANARNVIANAIVGLVITIFATRLVGFVATRFNGEITNQSFLLPNVTIGEGTLTTVLNIAFQVAAMIAVLFIIWGGISYSRSNGDPGTIQRSRQMIIYALVGLVIVVAAQAIVTFVFDRIIAPNADQAVIPSAISALVSEVIS